jgi:hypothetical protein
MVSTDSKDSIRDGRGGCPLVMSISYAEAVWIIVSYGTYAWQPAKKSKKVEKVLDILADYCIIIT